MTHQKKQVWKMKEFRRIIKRLDVKHLLDSSNVRDVLKTDKTTGFRLYVKHDEKDRSNKNKLQSYNDYHFRSYKINRNKFDSILNKKQCHV